ncbi:hypothetical protein H17ap60334_04952 [Thermosipho africanus H17ap60334]|uniref:phage tail tube protein n=1 Tax=Thermosipho africanus TaxID=2421 RepID=UPI00028D04D9|nr:phage tail tube protein [Thermosipho africanus]EKF49532.1 hypothetical protein H17ap60334_04952 [Thermosipho africanus H17ap60334]
MYTGAKSSVLLGIESSFGSEATATWKLPFKSESLNHKVEAVRSEALLGTRGIKSLAPGKLGAEGSLDVELYPETAGVLFYLALGKSELDVSQTKITPIGLSEELPSASIEVNHSGQSFKYLGMKINQLRFSGAVGAIPSVTADFIGKEEQSGSLTQGSLTVPGDDPFYFKELKLYTDQFTTTTDLYSSIELTINNNLDSDDYRLDGTGKRKSLEPGTLEITGSLDIIFDSSVVSGEYASFKNFTEAAIGIELAKDATNKLTIYIPRLLFSNMTHDISGPDKIMFRAEFTALIPLAGEIIEVVDYTNGTGSY